MHSEGKYKGYPYLILQWHEDSKPLQMGLVKCELVMSHLKEIRVFIDKYKKDKDMEVE